MARRSDHSREELYDLALSAAREIAEAKGLRGLTARRIAEKIGYTPGTLYNVFENLDDLILRLNGTTLDALYEVLARENLDTEPEAALKALAGAYMRFAGAHPKLWSILFDHHLPDGRELPDWHHEKIRRLLGLAEFALSQFFPPGMEDERHHSARVIWSSIYGMNSLASSRKLPPTISVPELADSLITYYVAGLRQQLK